MYLSKRLLARSVLLAFAEQYSSGVESRDNDNPHQRWAVEHLWWIAGHQIFNSMVRRRGRRTSCWNSCCSLSSGLFFRKFRFFWHCNNISDARPIAVKNNFRVPTQMTETNFGTFKGLFSTKVWENHDLSQYRYDLLTRMRQQTNMNRPIKLPVPIVYAKTILSFST